MKPENKKESKSKLFWKKYKPFILGVLASLLASIILLFIEDVAPKPEIHIIVVLVVFFIVLVAYLLLNIHDLYDRFFEEHNKNLNNEFGSFKSSLSNHLDKVETALENKFEEFKKPLSDHFKGVKKNLNDEFENFKTFLFDYFDIVIYQNQFSKRKKQFPVEKEHVANEFVTVALPELNNLIKVNYRNVERVNYILGAGTTIAPIFKELEKNDFSTDKFDYTFFTNNLAGIEEIHKYSKTNEEDSANESYLVITGSPAGKYKATQGQKAIDFLNTIKSEKEEKNSKEEDQKEINVGILTSNWFLIGLDFNNLQLCARGEHHYKFKKKLIDISDFIVLVSPLGKILKLDDKELLNNALPEDEQNYKYKTIPIPNSKIEKTFLFTSFRPRKSNSPLQSHSEEIERRIDRPGKNYSFFKHKTIFKPEGTLTDIILSEFPHGYIREKYEDFYD